MESGVIVQANIVKPISTRTRTLLAVIAVSVLALGVIGVAAVTGVIPPRAPNSPGEAPLGVAAGAPTRILLSPSACALCGTVESIRSVETRGDGGEAGRAISLTRILRAAADAVAGKEGEESVKRSTYRVTVRMDDGSYRTVSQPSPPEVVVGDKVRLVEGRLVRG